MSTLVSNFYKKADIDTALEALTQEITSCEPMSSYAAQFLNNFKKKMQVFGLNLGSLQDLYANLSMKFSFDKNVQMLMHTIEELFTCLKFRLYMASNTMCDDCECEKFLQLLDEFTDEKSLIDGINKGQFRQFAQVPAIEQILADHVPADSDYIKLYATSVGPRFEYVNGDVRYVSLNNQLYEICNNVISVCHTLTQNTVLLRDLCALLDRGIIKIDEMGIKMVDPDTEEDQMVIDAVNATCAIRGYNNNWINFDSTELNDVYGCLATMESFARSQADMFKVITMRKLWSVYNDDTCDLIVNVDPQYIKVYESAMENVPSFALLWCGKNVIDLNNYCEYENFDAFCKSNNPLYCFM